MPRGGYQKPSNEKRAAVSNPRSGKRTDGMAGTRQAMREIPANGDYGSRIATAQATAGAPQGLAGNSTPRPAMPPITPLNAPTQFPERPVTHGHAVGPGYTPDPSIPDRFAKINQYKDMFDTIAADSPPAFQVFWNAVLSQSRNA